MAGTGCVLEKLRRSKVVEKLEGGGGKVVRHLEGEEERSRGLDWCLAGCTLRQRGREEGFRGRWTSRRGCDVPFEFVGEVASACTMTEASNVESSTTTTRHDLNLLSGKMKIECTRSVVQMVWAKIIKEQRFKTREREVPQETATGLSVALILSRSLT